jgi:hypothetical protein
MHGLLLHAIVHSAGVQDRDGGIWLLATLFGQFPCMGLFLSRSFKSSASFLPSSVFFVRPKARFFVPTRASFGPARAGAVKVGRRTNLAACSTLARPHLDSSEHDGTLDADGMTIRGEPALRARINRATTLYPVGPKTRTMMQPCASAAKLRSGGPILFFGMRAMEIVGTRHLEPSSATRRKGTDSAKPVGGLQQPRFIAPGAERHLLAPRPLSQTATRRSEACAPRPLSWSCDCRGRSRCGLETTAPGHCPSGT